MARRASTKLRTASRATKSRKAGKGKALARPNFEPIFTKDEAIETANDVLRADHPSAVALRMTCVILSGTPEDAMRAAEDNGEVGFTEEVVKLIIDAEAHLKARLDMMAAAKARILWAACYVHGGDFSPMCERSGAQ